MIIIRKFTKSEIKKLPFEFLGPLPDQVLPRKNYAWSSRRIILLVFDDLLDWTVDIIQMNQNIWGTQPFSMRDFTFSYLCKCCPKYLAETPFGTYKYLNCWLKMWCSAFLRKNIGTTLSGVLLKPIFVV